MLGFVRREGDILVATTIIESGLDIPNVNTIFINQADNYGLADLHQLRGRVGRYKHRAYAYLLLDSERTITPTAARRLKAIEEFTELGAGFKIALRDLEIRGAGNILGTQQSGHIAAVGYEMYCQLLENAVRQIKQQPVRDAAGSDRRSALASLPAARLRHRPTPENRSLSTAGANSAAGATGRLSPGAARPLRIHSGAGRMAAAPGGTAAAGIALASGDGSPGEASRRRRRAHGRRDRLSQPAENRPPGRTQRRPPARRRWRKRLISDSPRTRASRTPSIRS